MLRELVTGATRFGCPHSADREPPKKATVPTDMGSFLFPSSKNQNQRCFCWPRAPSAWRRLTWGLLESLGKNRSVSSFLWRSLFMKGNSKDTGSNLIRFQSQPTLNHLSQQTRGKPGWFLEKPSPIPLWCLKNRCSQQQNRWILKKHRNKSFCHMPLPNVNSDNNSKIDLKNLNRKKDRSKQYLWYLQF